MLVSGRVRVIEFMTHLGESCPKSSRSVTGQESSPRRCHPIATISHCRPAGPHWGWHLLGFLFFSGIQKFLPKKPTVPKKVADLCKNCQVFLLIRSCICLDFFISVCGVCCCPAALYKLPMVETIYVPWQLGGSRS